MHRIWILQSPSTLRNSAKKLLFFISCFLVIVQTERPPSQHITIGGSTGYYISANLQVEHVDGGRKSWLVRKTRKSRVTSFEASQALCIPSHR